MHSNLSFVAVLLLFSILCLSSTLAAGIGDADLTSPKPKGFHYDNAAFHHRRQHIDSFFQDWRRTTSDICPANYTQCGNGLPSNFCCPSGNSCNALADNTTVLCCPDNEDCSSIETITCDITSLNATAHPSTSVHTTNLTGELPTCGSGCCPFGYACNVNESETSKSTCVVDGTSTLVTDPSSSSSASSNTATGTNTGLMLASATVEPEYTTTSSSSASAASRRRMVGIAAGSTAAAVACIGGIIAYAIVRRRNAKRAIEMNRDLGNHNRPTRPAVPVHARSASTLAGQKLAPPERSPPPPPLPPKEPYQIPKRKRKSLLSWVPSSINRTPVELPATPVSSSHWGELERPRGAYLLYQEASPDQVHEMEADARWRPDEHGVQ